MTNTPSLETLDQSAYNRSIDPLNCTFLSGGGAMGNLLRNPTSGSPEVLHGPETWPAPVKTLISIMLNANQPMYIA